MLLFVAIAFSDLFDNTQFFKINLYLFIQFGAFGLQLLDLGHHGVDIDLLFLFERIDIARNIEIVVVLGNLLQCCAMTVFLYLCAVTVSLDDFADVLGA